MEQTIIDILATHQLWICIGFIIAARSIIGNLSKLGVRFPLIILAIIVCIYGSFLGSRLLYILRYNPNLFITDPGFTFMFWREGFCWIGGLLFSVFLFGFVMFLAKKPVLRAMDAIVPGLPIVHAAACFSYLLQNSYYGAITTAPWSIFASDAGATVQASVLSTIVFSLIIAMVLQILWKKSFMQNHLIFIYGLMLGVYGFITELIIPASYEYTIIAGLGFNQFVYIIVSFISLSSIILFLNKTLGRVVISITVVILILFIGFKHTTDFDLNEMPERDGLYLVATRSMFVNALNPWKTFREKQGFNVKIKQWETPPQPEELSAWINRQPHNKIRNILIVGDCAAKEEEKENWHIPSLKTPQGHLCDSRYGDLDGDGCPDIPVGRFPVRDIPDLKKQINKTIYYEKKSIEKKSYRMFIWTGAPRYDSLVLTLTRHARAMIPDWLDAYIMCGVNDSIYSGHPPDQPWIFLKALKEPNFLSVCVVHGWPQGIDPVRYQGEHISFSVLDVPKLESVTPLNPLLVLACDSGTFDLPQSKGPSLSEAFLQHPGGPVAVVASSGSDGPLTNYLVIRSISSAFDTYSANTTIGDILLNYQRELYDLDEASAHLLDKDYNAIKQIRKAIPKRMQAKFSSYSEIKEEILRYNLLGDPAVRVKMPKPMKVKTKVDDTGRLIASGITPNGCKKLYVDIVDAKQKFDKTPRNLPKSEKRKLFNQVNKPASLIFEKSLTADTWNIEVPLKLKNQQWKYNIRFFAVGKQEAYYAVVEL